MSQQPDHHPRAALNIDGFWRHCLCVGVTARLIAVRRKRDPKPLEEYFVAGLVHDIGWIPLNNKLPTGYVEGLAPMDREHLPCTSPRSGPRRSTITSWNHGTWMGARSSSTTSSTAAPAPNAINIGFTGDRHPREPPAFGFDELGIGWDELEAFEDLVTKEIAKAKVFLQVTEPGGHPPGVPGRAGVHPHTPARTR